MFLISFCWGNSALPFGDGLVAHADRVGELPLCQMLLLPQGADERPGTCLIHVLHLPCGSIIGNLCRICNRRSVESFSLSKPRSLSPSARCQRSACRAASMRLRSMSGFVPRHAWIRCSSRSVSGSPLTRRFAPPSVVTVT